MAGRKLRTKIFLALLSVVLVLVLVIAAMPLWFPWVLPPIAKRFGASYTGYRRVGYQQFELSGFTLTNGPTHVDASQARGFIPTVWLWKHFTGARDENFVQVQSWKYRSCTSDDKSSSSPATNAVPSTISADSVFHELQSIAIALRDWVPNAKLNDGIVVVDHPGPENRQPQVGRTATLTATLTLSVTNPPILASASTTQALWPMDFAYRFRAGDVSLGALD